MRFRDATTGKPFEVDQKLIIEGFFFNKSPLVEGSTEPALTPPPWNVTSPPGPMRQALAMFLRHPRGCNARWWLDTEFDELVKTITDRRQQLARDVPDIL